MPSKKTKVFLDANVVIQTGKPPGGPIMERVADLVNAGFISVLTTDLTVCEVTKKHTENDYEVIKEAGRPHFRKLAKEHLQSTLPEINKSALKETISKKYSDQVIKMFNDLDSKYLSIDNVKPSTVFADYSNGNGFFTGEGKKDQFPDAFIFECLKAEASKETPVFIVSNDDDFKNPVKSINHISLLKSIPDLFKELGLQVEAPSVEQYLEENNKVLIELFDNELTDWGLQVSDIEDAEIEESTVTNIELSNIISCVFR
ncbi:MAG TPA: PIN domain-containing protein [Deltaproteobacteria bacterium]|nr:PIN domain-containing protein [Deltaproteobacteria bacterium]